MNFLPELVSLLHRKKRIAVLTGSGISAESGIPTFRGKNGLWKSFRPEELATPEAFNRDSKLVWEWYNWRREIISSKKPTTGHEVLAQWESIFPSFALITQNIDGLHQKAGSKNIIELHGNIWKFRCTKESTVIENHEIPLKEIPPICAECGALLRPHVVWFGEPLPSEIINKALQVSSTCEVMFVIGTSAVGMRNISPPSSEYMSSSSFGICPEP